MKVGDLVAHDGWQGLGIVTCIDPEELGDLNEVEVTWSDGVVSNHSAGFLEVVSEKAS